MRYAEYKAGKVVAHYSHPNSVAQVELPEDHPDLVAFQKAREELIESSRKERELLEPKVIRGLVRLLSELSGRSEDEILEAIK